MAKREDLPADPDAVEKWKNLPQTERSKSALPPMTGGMAWNRTLLWGMAVIGLIIAVIAIVNQLLSK